MPEANPALESPSHSSEKSEQIRTIEEALRSLTGKPITVSTPDSLQAVPMGYQIKPSCYKAKILKVFEGMAVLAVEGSKRPNETKPTTLKQYLALSAVRRICVGKDEFHLHL